MGSHLLDKVWKLHSVKGIAGQTQLFIGLHLLHEVTSPQAFGMLKEKNLKVLYPQRNFATVDHIVPTDNQSRPFSDSLAEEMMRAIEENCKEHNITFFGLETEYQGIVHVIGPELGLTWPGMTIACGDSHTSTHGAFGSLAFGIGTSQVRDVLASQTLLLSKPKVRRIEVEGKLQKGVYAKDIILKIISILGVKGGIGYAYEYAGSTIENLSMEERMTLCNMSIEGGARIGYINPDQTTFDYIKEKKYSPKKFEKALEFWKSICSDPEAEYDDEIIIQAEDIEPMVTWGIHPGQAIGVSECLPKGEEKRAYEHMNFEEGMKIKGTKIDVAFIGSCTNGRISDLREAASVVRGKKVSDHVKAMVVPGSKQVSKKAVTEGLDRIFTEAGFQWRGAGCSMCLAMNPDKLEGNQLCASSSNRNFIGRQGSPAGRTLLMSPAMVAGAAIAGKVVDIREN